MIVAYVLIAVATLAAVYDAKILVLDVAWTDHRVNASSSTRNVLLGCLAGSAALIALPLALGGWLACSGHNGWAITVAILSLVISALGFVVLAGGSRP